MYKATLSKVNAGQSNWTNNTYEGEGSTVKVAKKRARLAAENDGYMLISGIITVTKETENGEKYIGTYGI